MTTTARRDTPLRPGMIPDGLATLTPPNASVAELADAPGLGPGVLRDLRVRVPPLAPLRRPIAGPWRTRRRGSQAGDPPLLGGDPVRSASVTAGVGSDAARSGPTMDAQPGVVSMNHFGVRRVATSLVLRASFAQRSWCGRCRSRSSSITCAHLPVRHARDGPRARASDRVVRPSPSSASGPWRGCRVPRYA